MTAPKPYHPHGTGRVPAMTPQQLRQLRAYLDVTQVALGKALGVSRQHIMRWETDPLLSEGKPNPIHRAIDRGWATAIRLIAEGIVREKHLSRASLKEFFTGIKSKG